MNAAAGRGAMALPAGTAETREALKTMTDHEKARRANLARPGRFQDTIQHRGRVGWILVALSFAALIAILFRPK